MKISKESVQEILRTCVAIVVLLIAARLTLLIALSTNLPSLFLILLALTFIIIILEM